MGSPAVTAIDFNHGPVAEVEVSFTRSSEIVGSTTEIFAVAVLPGPPSTESMTPVVFTNSPAVAPVTVTENEHEAPAVKVPPVRVMDPATPSTVSVPPHSELVDDATVIPAGRTSTNSSPVNALLPLGLSITNESVEVSLV